MPHSHSGPLRGPERAVRPICYTSASGIHLFNRFINQICIWGLVCAITALNAIETAVNNLYNRPLNKAGFRGDDPPI